MNLKLPPLDSSFRSPSQQSRIFTEKWGSENCYCPSCGTGLSPYPAGTRVYDFFSSDCSERFQLKSSHHAFGMRVLGSEYRTTLESILADTQPSLILLHYERIEWVVEDLSFVHRACITPSCVVPRKPLGPLARRAGWQGCNFWLDRVPSLGRIEVVRKGVVRDKSGVLEQWKQNEKLLSTNPATRGWLADILRCVESLSATFTLKDVYSFEEELSLKHSGNNNVKAKIRQQLQVLRDLGFVEFLSPGMYRYLRRNP